MATIVIAGFGPNSKVPGPVTEVKYGVGTPSPGAATYKLLIVAPKASAGTAVEDSEIFPIRTEEDVITKGGAGSEIHLAAKKALRRKVSIFGICPSLSSPTSATNTITVTGTWTTAGSWALRIDGITISSGILKTNNKVAVAAKITSVINATTNLPCTAVQGTSVGVDDNTTVLTMKTSGLRGNRTLVWVISTDLPSGATVASTGGTAVTGGAVPFSGGAVVENITTLLTPVGLGWYHYIAAAQFDSTNLGRWRTWLDAQAAPFVEKPSFMVFGSTESLSTAGSHAQNDCNDAFMQEVWQLNGESHPTELAAAMAALRCEAEQSNANADYDDAELLDIVPTDPAAVADIADYSTKQAALDEGVTPLYTTTDGHVLVARSITTLSLKSALPYYGTLDTSEAVVPQVVRYRLKVRWIAFKAVNPYLRAEPSRSEPTAPPLVATPSRWNGVVADELLNCENDLLITETTTNVPLTEFDATANRFMTKAVVKVLKHQHMVGISVQQLAS